MNAFRGKRTTAGLDTICKPTWFAYELMESFLSDLFIYSIGSINLYGRSMV